MEKKLDNIQKLFLEKKYSELIYFIEYKIDEKQKNSGILNLLGACKILKGKLSKESLSSAIEDFRQGYLKEKETKYALEALRNFINASVDLYDFENSSANHKISINNFDDAILYFKEIQSLFENDELLILALTRIFKRLGDTDQTIFYLGKLIENKHYRLLTICSYIYQNSFNNNWSQKEFLKYGKFLAEKLPKYPEDRMVKINNSKNNKIRIAPVVDLRFELLKFFTESLLN